MFFVWTSLSTVQNRNLHCFTLTRKKTYYDSFSNKCRSDFLTVVMTTKQGVSSMTLLRNVLTWLPSQQKKTSSTFRIIDLTFWPWRFQIIVLEKTVNKIQILNQSETKKKFEEDIYFLKWFLHLVVINVWQLVWLLE